MSINSISSQPFPASNSNCFTQIDICSRGRKKNAHPKLVLTIPPEANEKEITVQRVPLVIEYLQNNWTLHGWEPKKNIGLDKKTANDTNSYAATLSHNQSRTNERENAKSNKTEQRERPVGRAEHSQHTATNVNSSGSVAMEEVADKLRQSALQSSNAKRRHLSLAEQAMENEAEKEMNEQPSSDGSLSQSVVFECQSCDNGKGRDEDEMGTPPPSKQGRTE
ncbi:hypothetical protein niasHT_037093 [Heterodera trifolii]|uniref:Uncharacterized protein n=1 Tax=Heterodera trifolii TaxID=157864 RepID=A0ABD2IX67_9BILA